MINTLPGRRHGESSRLAVKRALAVKRQEEQEGVRRRGERAAASLVGEAGLTTAARLPTPVPSG
jgi:hypothetical protein